LRSETAWVSGGGNTIRLQGEVFVFRDAGPTTKPLNLQTRELTLKRDQNYAETDRPVNAASNMDWLTSAKGARIWFGEELRIKLLGRARGQIAVP
jgi:hypothetical protein